MFTGLASPCLFNNSAHLNRNTFILSDPVWPAKRGVGAISSVLLASCFTVTNLSCSYVTLFFTSLFSSRKISFPVLSSWPVLTPPLLLLPLSSSFVSSPSYFIFSNLFSVLHSCVILFSSPTCLISFFLHLFVSFPLFFLIFFSFSFHFLPCCFLHFPSSSHQVSSPFFLFPFLLPLMFSYSSTELIIVCTVLIMDCWKSVYLP